MLMELNFMRKIYSLISDIPCLRMLYTNNGKNISLLVVSVGQACNYKCKNCGAMVPYSRKVDGSSDFARRLADYIVKKHFMESCRYCYGTDNNYLCTPAEQIEDDK